MTILDLRNRFPSRRQNGPLDWHGPCPAHDDTRQDPEFSLHVSVTADRILLHCFAGCEAAAILRAIELSEPDLLFSHNGHARVPRLTKGEAADLLTAAFVRR